MGEVRKEEIDLIVTSPPYNIGTKYSNFADEEDFQKYRGLLETIFSECFRVLKKRGEMVIEVADTVFMNGRYISLAGLLQVICIKIGFSLKERHINFTQTKKGIEFLDHGWHKDYTTKNNAHSNCHQFLVFSKSKTNFNFDEGSIHYSNYNEGASKEHPCPFPESHFFLLDKYFKKGMDVLDPFMGTATLGVEVLKRGGNFYGYELVKDFFEIARKKLEKAEAT